MDIIVFEIWLWSAACFILLTIAVILTRRYVVDLYAKIEFIRESITSLRETIIRLQVERAEQDKIILALVDALALPLLEEPTKPR